MLKLQAILLNAKHGIKSLELLKVYLSIICNISTHFDTVIMVEE